MKALVAALMFFLQLQPLVGAAVCLHGSGATRSACEMVDGGRRGVTPAADLGQASVAPAGSPAHGCTLAQVCAASAPAIPQFGTHFQLAFLIHDAPAKITASLAPGDPAAPPLPPPIA